MKLLGLIMLMLATALVSTAQDARVIQLKDTDAFTAQKVYDALRKAEKDRDEFEAYVKKTYLVVGEGDPDKGSMIWVGESGAWTIGNATFTVLGCGQVLWSGNIVFPSEKCKEEQAEWEKSHPRPKYQYYRAGWENGFLFSRDFRFLVPKPAPVIPNPSWYIKPASFSCTMASVSGPCYRLGSE